MKTLLFGANGQLGHRLAPLIRATALTREQADFSVLSKSALAALFDHQQPDIVVNAVAFTGVDDAESQFERASRINAEVPGWLAALAAERDIPFVHFSTDYVFDGERGAPYAEDARPNPRNRYGESKLAGEYAVLQAHSRAIVFRLQWLYDTRGKNFLRTMLRLMVEKEYLRIVADQLGAPSSALSVARTIAALLPRLADGALSPGIYHLAAEGYTSWHGFACAIRDEAQRLGLPCLTKVIEPIVSEEYPLPAPRPRDTRLDTGKLAQLGLTLPHWREALAETMKENHAGH